MSDEMADMVAESRGYVSPKTYNWSMTIAFAAGIIVAAFAFGTVLNTANEVIEAKQRTIDFLMESGSPYEGDPQDFIEEHTFEEICGVEL